jgi:hypothetical protein
MKQSFADIWDRAQIGTVLRVSNGQAEPGDPTSPEWMAWLSHNLTGTVVDRHDGPPRALCISFSNLVCELTYAIQDDDAHMFELVEPDLDDRKGWKAAAARDRCDVAQLGGCDTPLGRVQTDVKSQSFINGASSMALMAKTAGLPFSIVWTMADNTNVEHDADQMLALGMAVGQFINACHQNLISIRAAIAAIVATDDPEADAAALDAIDLEEGWPT